MVRAKVKYEGWLLHSLEGGRATKVVYVENTDPGGLLRGTIIKKRVPQLLRDRIDDLLAEMEHEGEHQVFSKFGPAGGEGESEDEGAGVEMTSLSGNDALKAHEVRGHPGTFAAGNPLRAGNGGLLTVKKRAKGEKRYEESLSGTLVNNMRSEGTVLGGGETGGISKKKLPLHIARAETFNNNNKERGKSGVGKGKGKGMDRGKGGPGPSKVRASQQSPSSHVRVNSSELLDVVKLDEDVRVDLAKDLPSSPPPDDEDDDENNDDDDAKLPALPSIQPANQLKVGWTEHIDPATNYPYWTNDETGESTWHKP